MDDKLDRNGDELETLEAVDVLIDDLRRRMRIAVRVREMIEEGKKVPDIQALVGLPEAEDRRKRPWVLRPGTDGDKVVSILERAGGSGLTEPEIVEEMRRQGRLLHVKDAVRSVHWTLYNLARKSNALERDKTGRWRLTREIDRRA
jgi:hypothetical protein